MIASTGNQAPAVALMDLGQCLMVRMPTVGEVRDRVHAMW